MNMFRWACVLIASPQSFEEGISSASVEKGVSVLKQKAQWWGDTYIEKGRKEGRKEGIEEEREKSILQLMTNLGWTRDRAMEALGLKFPTSNRLKMDL